VIVLSAKRTTTTDRRTFAAVALLSNADIPTIVGIPPSPVNGAAGRRGWNVGRSRGTIEPMRIPRVLAWGLIAGTFGAALACTSPDRGVIILCAGDSLTEQGYPRYLRAAIRADGVRARVLNYGRSGNTSAEYLAFLENDKSRLAAERPDIVLVELGTNDVRVDGDRATAADFERNLRAIVAVFKDFQTRAGQPPAVFLASVPPVPAGTPFPFGPDSGERVAREINPAVRAVCRDLGAGFVDNHSLFEASPELLPGVHPGPKGYEAMAANWYAAIRGRLGRVPR
jgi:lysophospholipase L1-like esterase